MKMLCEPPEWVLRITEERPTNQLSAMNARLETLSIAELDFNSENEDHGTRLNIEAWSLQVSCRSSCDAQPPFDDPDMQRIITIHDGAGAPIGTGYWDDIPRTGLVACTAVILLQAPDDNHEFRPEPMITYFLLLQEVGQSEEGMLIFERIGIGRTTDLLEGASLDNTWLQDTQRRTFVLQ